MGQAWLRIIPWSLWPGVDRAAGSCTSCAVDKLGLGMRRHFPPRHAEESEEHVQGPTRALRRLIEGDADHAGASAARAFSYRRYAAPSATSFIASCRWVAFSHE